MELTQIVKIINEFGPSVIMFGLGLWGAIKMIALLISGLKNSSEKLEKAENKKDEANERMIKLLLNALDQRDLGKQKQHDELAAYRKEVIRKCNNYAKEMLVEAGADKVAIYDYCNGTQSLAGIPFLHFRVIVEKENGRLKRNMYSEKLDINTLGTFLLDLEKEKMMTIKNIRKDEDKYPELAHFMACSRKHKGVFANIGGVNSTLGFISITFDYNKKVDYQKVEKILYDYSQKVSSLLDYSNINS